MALIEISSNNTIYYTTKYLREEWRTASKDSNKVKVFGTNEEYKTEKVI